MGKDPTKAAKCSPHETREPTNREAEIMKRHEARKARSKVGPRVKMDCDSGFTLENDLTNLGVDGPLFMETFATADSDAAFLMFGQICGLANRELPTKAALAVNGMLALIRAIGPRDEVETMLASQMIAVHMATMEAARRLRVAETIVQMEYAERSFMRLSRTFALQLEALKKHRHSGEQRVTVEHVHIYQGGQAIVGNVTHGGGADSRIEGQPHERVRISECEAVHGTLEADRVPVQGTSVEGLERLQVPRSKRGATVRRTKRKL